MPHIHKLLSVICLYTSLSSPLLATGIYYMIHGETTERRGGLQALILIIVKSLKCVKPVKWFLRDITLMVFVYKYVCACAGGPNGVHFTGFSK